MADVSPSLYCRFGTAPFLASRPIPAQRLRIPTNTAAASTRREESIQNLMLSPFGPPIEICPPGGNKPDRELAITPDGNGSILVPGHGGS